MGDGVAVLLAKYLISASLICLSLCYLLGVPITVSSAAENTSIYFSQRIVDVQAYVPKNGSLARLGSQLHFDYATCPNSSLIRNNSVKLVARHDDCPQVFILGARKGGTTSLIKYLSAHPDFTGANINDSYHAGETGYFSRFYYRKWWKYKAQFVGEGYMLGDSSVNNFVNCRVPSRMYKFCGDSMKSMKFIMLLRDPVERFQSNYRFRVHSGFPAYIKDRINMSYFVNREMNNFHNAILKQGLDINTAQNHLNDMLCMFIPSMNAIYEGLYLVHLHQWLCNVPAENILILNSEEFFHHTADILSEVIHFIGLSPLSNKTIASIVSQKYNANPELKLEQSQHLLSQSERQRIKSLYQPFNLKLLDLFYWPHTLWS